MEPVQTDKELLMTVKYHDGQRDRVIDKCLNLGCCLGGCITSRDDHFNRVPIIGTEEQKELIDAFPEVDLIAWRDAD